jgi:RimJ/RimL family protein N-acetyltransferase
MSDRIALRPVEETDLPIIEALTQDPETTGEFAWFGWYNLGRIRQAWAENRLTGPQFSILMAVDGEEALGFVSWRRLDPTPAAFCWTMGIALLPGARGKGNGTLIHKLLVRYLFAHTTVHRIEADTEVGNIAEQRALEKAGFTREGVMRGAGWRDGEYRDGVTYSILRTDPLP